MVSRRGLGPLVVLERFGARAVLAAVGVLLAALVLAALVLFARGRSGPVHTFDLNTAAHLNRYLNSHHGQVRFWKSLTNAGGPTTWRVLAGVAVIVLAARRRWATAALIAVAMVGAAVLSGVTKLAVNRARPVVAVPVTHVGGGSFPSGHALTSFVALGLAVILLRPVLSRGRWLLATIVAAVLIFLIGFSRLILGVHYVTDVLGGWLIAALWLAALTSVFRSAVRRRTGPRSSLT
jgi:undecaprenyl-diphosphatase